MSDYMEERKKLIKEIDDTDFIKPKRDKWEILGWLVMLMGLSIIYFSLRK